jgi:hypothetical protein
MRSRVLTCLGFSWQRKFAAFLPNGAKFWLPFVEMGEERVGPERLREGDDLMMQVPRPYIIEGALAELG